MEIKKIETCNYVMFPRTQLPGLTCDDNALIPSRQDFDVELIHDVPNMGTVNDSYLPSCLRHVSDSDNT